MTQEFPYKEFLRSQPSVIDGEPHKVDVDYLDTRRSFPSELGASLEISAFIHQTFEDELSKLPVISGRSSTEIFSWLVSSVQDLLRQFKVVKIGTEQEEPSQETENATRQVSRPGTSNNTEDRSVTKPPTFSRLKRPFFATSALTIDPAPKRPLTYAQRRSPLTSGVEPYPTSLLTTSVSNSPKTRTGIGAARGTPVQIDLTVEQNRADINEAVYDPRECTPTMLNGKDNTAQEIEPQGRARERQELRRLEAVIGRGNTPPNKIQRIMDKARTLKPLPLLSIPFELHDKNLGQYWIKGKPLQNFRAYIALGLRDGGYISSGPSPHVIHYDTAKKAFRFDRIVNYLKTFGLSHIDTVDLSTYLETVSNEKRLSIAQTRALTERCGLDFSDFFRVCESGGGITIICLLCEPGSEHSKLTYDSANSNHDHFLSFHGIDAKNSSGRCHFPGCPTVWPIPKIRDEEIERKRDDHLKSCPRRHVLFPNES